MPFLIGVIILIIFIVGIYLYIRKKLKDISNRYLGGQKIGDIIEKARLEDEEVPKSLASMESVYLDVIKKDFPEVNINELKRKSEKLIIDTYMAIENKDLSKISKEKIKRYVKSRIDDLVKESIKY